MINTIDFITPPVDDPWWFGQIAAANSISDIYSMGGVPLTALNVVMFPAGHLDMGILKEIIRGGHDKVVEAGAVLVGGHSVDDEEPKYGLCVNGLVHPDRVITNAGARADDALILTKPVGSGVLFNAVRSGKYPFAELERLTLPKIAALNGKAMEVAKGFEIHGCTDITGFGILGHLLEVSLGANRGVVVEYDKIPFYPGALEMYAKGETTGSNKANRAMVNQSPFSIERELSRNAEELLFDPQTSGGLLFSTPGVRADELVVALHAAGVGDAVRIGEVADSWAGIRVV